MIENKVATNASAEALELAIGLQAQWPGIGHFGPQIGKLIVDEFGYRKLGAPRAGQPSSTDEASDEARELGTKIARHEPALQMMAPHISYVAVDFLGYRIA
ncbi:hypothetical protein [Rhodococcus sp. NPDC060176]|uniref:hypothetical protein n=1 Tax=Rhodococcus sp. NPDC060176 TaxID=3347062 RepID=UPI0036664F5D